MPIKLYDYNREDCLVYAKKWARLRNPHYFDFENLGGDCTNFASQCLYAGSKAMNFTPVTGWYYVNSYNRSASWTGVSYFYDFMTQNKGIGPFGREAYAAEILPADFIQLYRNGRFTHTLVVTSVSQYGFYAASHSMDSYNRALSTYNYDSLRYIHIEGVRRS